MNDSYPKQIAIADRLIGERQPCFLIAEAGVNHNGDLATALRLVDVAAEAGADAVKFQTFCADRLVTRSAPKADYQIQATGSDESQYEMLRRLELSTPAHQELISYCRKKKILFLSTPFDEESADLLDDLGLPFFKIPSGEVTNLPFLTHVARKQKPMIVSTGMADLSEVAQAVRAITKTGNRSLILLHCVSNYPTDPADVNLRAMKTMESEFDLPVGYSDHTLGIEVALAAATLGACVIEKHFTLDRRSEGPDHAASLEPDELKALVRGIRMIESSLGHGRKEPVASERKTAEVARKSLVAACDIPAGTVLREELIAVKRPGTGLAPALKTQLVGRMVQVDVPEGALLKWEILR